MLLSSPDYIGEETMNIICELQYIWLTISYPFRKPYTACNCGHKTKAKGVHTLRNGSKVLFWTLPKIGYCPSCIEKMATTCPGCGETIHINVWIRTKQARQDTKNGGVTEIVGCRSCEELPTDLDGVWEIPGKATPDVWSSCTKNRVSFFISSVHKEPTPTN